MEQGACGLEGRRPGAGNGQKTGQGAKGAEEDESEMQEAGGPDRWSGPSGSAEEEGGRAGQEASEQGWRGFAAATTEPPWPCMQKRWKAMEVPGLVGGEPVHYVPNTRDSTFPGADTLAAGCAFAVV